MSAQSKLNHTPPEPVAKRPSEDEPLVKPSSAPRQTGSFATQQCHVIDISGTGFRLRAMDTDRIPNDFTLLFSKRGPGRRASVIWRRGTEVGAEFSIANPPPPHA